MKKHLFVFIVLFTAIYTNAQEKINWISFEKAIELNKENPKPILIDLYTDWCGWCKKMDKDTYSNEVIIESVNKNFYAVKLDGEGKETILYKEQAFNYKNEGGRKYHELAAALTNGKLSYPSTLFLSEEVQLIQNISGYHSAENFEKIIAYFSNKNYTTENWSDFEKEFKSKL